MSELNTLAFTIALGLLHLFAVTGAKTQVRGLKWNMGPRDNNARPLPEKIARFDRAFENFKETFPFFVGAVFLVQASGASGILSQTAALAYLIARVAYVPLYVFGIAGLRSLSWFASALGIIGVIAQFFLNV